MVRVEQLFLQSDDLSKFVDHFLDMRQLAMEEQMYGPFILLHSEQWSERLNKPYVLPRHNEPTMTLRGRLLNIEGLVAVTLCKDLENFDLLLVQAVVKSGDGHGDDCEFLGKKDKISDG